MRGAITKKVELKRISDGKVILAKCSITENAFERMVGLLGKKRLNVDEGLWIDGCNSIHTFFMRFPIDAVFLDASGKILKIYPNLKPWRLSWIHWRARSVLEIAAGQCKDLGLEVGEVLQSCSLS